MKLILSDEPNALFDPDDAQCEECPRTDHLIFLDAENDEYCAVLCPEHLLFTISAAIHDGRTNA